MSCQGCYRPVPHDDFSCDRCGERLCEDCCAVNGLCVLCRDRLAAEEQEAER